MSEQAPLLNNHPPAHVGPGRNVVISVDESEFSREALMWALDTIITKEDSITLLNVFHFEPFPTLDMYGGGPNSANDINDALEKAAEKTSVELLKSLGRVVKEKGFHVHMTAVRGVVKESIVDFTDRHNPDLLIMGSRGLGAVKRFFVGSVADYCVHHCKCPVIVKKH